ncbi:hypothetical protein F5Y17DRAFT_322939 [Xylariaceae sp. FL0594]|nr:hypothetical protein F5Y17DRAFT_322939 [Xylariaceae sp. FL0594]
MSANANSTAKEGGRGGTEKKKKPFDLVNRGIKEPTPGGTLAFIGLRLADMPLQKALLAPSTTGLGARLLGLLGLRTIFTHPSPAINSSQVLPLGAISSPASRLAENNNTSVFFSSPLTSLSPTGLILFLMSCGSAAKQIYWLLCLSQESFPVSAAAAVSGYNTLVNTANSLLFIALATTSAVSFPRLTFVSPHVAFPLSTIVGTLLYVAGMTIETLAERQRAKFKAAPENKGKVCKIGLWRWARHVNYFGYSLWRGGYCMVATGWIGGLAMGIWQGWDLNTRATLALDTYCANRYGPQWEQFKKEVPYKIIPGIY